MLDHRFFDRTDETKFDSSKLSLHREEKMHSNESRPTRFVVFARRATNERRTGFGREEDYSSAADLISAELRRPNASVRASKLKEERGSPVRTARIPRGAFRKHLPPAYARAETAAAMSATILFYFSTIRVQFLETNTIASPRNFLNVDNYLWTKTFLWRKLFLYNSVSVVLFATPRLFFLERGRNGVYSRLHLRRNFLNVDNYLSTKKFGENYFFIIYNSVSVSSATPRLFFLERGRNSVSTRFHLQEM